MFRSFFRKRENNRKIGKESLKYLLAMIFKRKMFVVSWKRFIYVYCFCCKTNCLEDK